MAKLCKVNTYPTADVLVLFLPNVRDKSKEYSPPTSNTAEAEQLRVDHEKAWEDPVHHWPHRHSGHAPEERTCKTHELTRYHVVRVPTGEHRQTRHAQQSPGNVRAWKRSEDHSSSKARSRRDIHSFGTFGLLPENNVSTKDVRYNQSTF